VAGGSAERSKLADKCSIYVIEVKAQTPIEAQGSLVVGVNI
jgi:hypothetical protein